jgi:L-fuconolactonase
MRIDAHQHFWNYDSKRFEWITDDMAALWRNFLPEDLYPILQASQIDGCIAKQVDPAILESIRVAGILEMSIYRWEQRLSMILVTTDDFSF